MGRIVARGLLTRAINLVMQKETATLAESETWILSENSPSSTQPGSCPRESLQQRIRRAHVRRTAVLRVVRPAAGGQRGVQVELFVKQ